MNNLSKLLSVLVVLVPVVSFASFTITPVKINMNENQKVASVDVKNRDGQEMYFQLSVLKVENQGGKESLTESKDLLVTPLVFKVGAGKSQLVRVAQKQSGSDHKHYVLVIKQLPRDKAKANTIKFITEFRVPIFINQADEKKASKKEEYSQLYDNTEIYGGSVVGSPRKSNKTVVSMIVPVGSRLLSVE